MVQTHETVQTNIRISREAWLALRRLAEQQPGRPSISAVIEQLALAEAARSEVAR